MTPPSVDGRRRDALRAVGSSLLVVLLLTAGIARLARVRRPSIRDATAIERTDLELARVVLARRGSSEGSTIGWTVRCRGATKREIVALPGTTRPSITLGARGELIVTRADFRREISDASCP